MTPRDTDPSQSCVLLLPGMSLNASIFPDLAVPTLDVDFTTMVLGEDGSLPRDAPGMESYVRELDRRTTESVVWQRARRRIVVGHSFGGMLAIEWLARRGRAATSVTGAVLIATSPGPMFDVVRLRVIRWGHREVRMRIKTLMSIWNRPTVTKVVKRLRSGGSLRVQRVDFRTLHDQRDAAVDAAGWKNTDWRAMRSFRLAMQHYDARRLLRSIDIPVIVLHGTDDSLLPAEQGAVLASGLPNAELRMIAGAGHALPLTHGSVVSEAVAALLQGTSAPSPLQ